MSERCRIGGGQKERTGSTSQQLTKDNLHRIEPIQHLGLATIGNTVPIPLAIPPQADLIEIMQP